VKLSSLAAGYEQFILDLDGCVWVGTQPTANAVDAIEALRDNGKRVAFVTNDARHAPEDYVRKLWGIGVRSSVTDVVTVGAALQSVLADGHVGQTAFVIGSSALHREVRTAGLRIPTDSDRIRNADIVIVGGTDTLSYEDLKVATLALQNGAQFLATSRDRLYPMPDGNWPGTGSIVASIEFATSRQAKIVGKPQPQLFRIACDRLGSARTLVIGDSLDSDIAAATEANLDAALVLTGATSKQQADESDNRKPVKVAPNLASIILAEAPR
jgi:HAD superfamily hydrolase (TIGR01450 family)